MKQRIKLGLFLPAMVCLSLVACGKLRHEIKITNEQIAKQLEKRFPITKTYLLIFDLTIENPSVMLKENSDRVTTQLEFQINITGQSDQQLLRGSGTATSGIAFDKKSGELYLTESTIDSLDTEGIPEAYRQQTNEVLGMALKEYLDNFPIYTLKAADVKTAIAKLFVKSVIIRDGVLVVTLGV